MRHLYKLIFWCVLIAFCLSTIGCHTMEGIGRDIEDLGQALQQAAD